MPRWLKPFALAAYCIGLLLLFDFVYSNTIHTDERLLRIPDPNFDHGLAAKFDGYDVWADRIYPVHTNSLGLDSTSGDVELSINDKRILLIGDSFTEGIGLRFEDTFAGLLYGAGQARPDHIEFLNVGVASYSPTLYYRKIATLLNRGLHFDEVIVFSDISDVPDEATSYFCFDDIPRYQSYCQAGTPAHFADIRLRRTMLQRNFTVLDATFRLLKMLRQSWFASQSLMVQQVTDNPAARWTVSTEADAFLRPLGIGGGIQRSLDHMQELADLLASRKIPLMVVVYPWITQLALDDRDSLQVSIWRRFCSSNCKTFVDLFPAFFAEKAQHPDWPSRLFIPGDFHYSEEGNRVVFDGLKTALLEIPIDRRSPRFILVPAGSSTAIRVSRAPVRPGRAGQLLQGRQCAGGIGQ